MGKQSAIEWTDATWNPWMGCTKVSPGCKNCYMFRDQKRYGHDPTVLRRSTTTFNAPLRWKESHKIFVCSWSDFFHPDVPAEWRRDAWEIIYHGSVHPGHIFLLLTKRPELIRGMLPPGYIEGQWKHFNVWLGVSVESQEYINRIGELYDIPAAVKFLSAEPLLGPLDLSDHMGFIDWVIVGGESGPDFRPMKRAWVKDIRDQCIESGIPFFFKQWGGKYKKNGAWGGRMLEGRTWDDLPRTP